MEKSKQPKNISWIRFTGIGFQMLGVILVFVYLGTKADSKWGNIAPLGTLVGSLFGIGAGLYLVLKEFVRKQ